MKTVLVPIDFPVASDRVIAESVALVRAASARVVVLHVVQPPVFADSDVGGGLAVKYAALAEAAAVKELSRLQRQLLAKGITIEIRHRVGLPGQVIVDEAETLGANYIALGSHGHGRRGGEAAGRDREAEATLSNDARGRPACARRLPRGSQGGGAVRGSASARPYLTVRSASSSASV